MRLGIYKRIEGEDASTTDGCLTIIDNPGALNLSQRDLSRFFSQLEAARVAKKAGVVKARSGASIFNLSDWHHKKNKEKTKCL